MKTIKELEAEIYKWRPSAKYDDVSITNVNKAQASLQTLKDVIKLMPELKAIITKGCMGTSANCYEIKKQIDAFIKARISG